jgi:hypothetical protein
MIYADVTREFDDYAAVDGFEPQAPTELISSYEPPERKCVEYAFNQTVFPLDDGKTLIRILQPLVLRIFAPNLEFEVKDWGIKMKIGEAANLPRQISRQFLSLFSKAERDQLDASEKVVWLRILDQTDYHQFIIDRSSPHYMEGTLLRKEPFYEVEWHDGSKERISSYVAASLEILEIGDRFSAYIKTGVDKQSLSIEKLTFL